MDVRAALPRYVRCALLLAGPVLGCLAAGGTLLTRDVPAAPAESSRTSVEAACAALRARYPALDCDFGPDADARSVVPLVRELLRLGERYPSAMRQLRSITVPQAPDHPQGKPWGLRAMVACPDGRLQCNPRYVRDADVWQRRLESMQQSGRTPPGCGRIEAYVAHEFGHLVMAAIGAPARAWAERTPGRSEVSGYASTDAYEGFAEAFACLQWGTARPGYVRALERFLGEQLPPQRMR
jgi:hypothetical protein